MGKKEKEEKNDKEDVEIVMGKKDDLNISDAKTCVNSLRPKTKKTDKDKIVIPKE